MMGGFFLAIINNNLVKTLCYISDKCLYGNYHDFKTLDFKPLNFIFITRHLASGSVSRLPF